MKCIASVKFAACLMSVYTEKRNIRACICSLHIPWILPTNCLWVKLVKWPCIKSRWRVKVIAELCFKICQGQFFLSLWHNLALTLPKKCLWIKTLPWSWTRFLGQGHMRSQRDPCLFQIFYSLDPIWLRHHPKRAHR